MSFVSRSVISTPRPASAALIPWTIPLLSAPYTLTTCDGLTGSSAAPTGDTVIASRLEVVTDRAEPVDELALLDRIGNLDQQHHREVATQDRHLRVLDVAVQVEQRPAHPRDDSRPI